MSYGGLQADQRHQKTAASAGQVVEHDTATIPIVQRYDKFFKSTVFHQYCRTPQVFPSYRLRCRYIQKPAMVLITLSSDDAYQHAGIQSNVPFREDRASAVVFQSGGGARRSCIHRLLEVKLHIHAGLFICSRARCSSDRIVTAIMFPGY